eukprot:799734_1
MRDVYMNWMSTPINSKKSTWTIWSRESPNKIQLLIYNFTMPFVVIATAASFALCLDMPFIFPSLGPTAYLHFAFPNSPAASPKNTLFAHFIGVIAGLFSLQVTGLYHHDNVFHEGVVFNRVFCSAISVGITCSFMILFNVSHPPSGATTLIVSLGILKTTLQLTVLMAAVFLITIEAFIINTIFRKDVVYPIWSVPKEDKVSASSGETEMATLSETNVLDAKLRTLKEQMTALTVDNFVECFFICKEIDNHEMMDQLIEFMIQNHHSLNEKKEYSQCISYTVRALVARYHY